MKVLLSTYACRPNMGSEPGVGWNVVRQVVNYHQIWAITREDNRPSIEAELASNPVPGLQFVYYDLPAWARWWNKDQRGVQLHYYLWQIGAYFHARKLHREVGFDLIHHVTYVRYWTPSFLALLPVPFLWGPVGGAESAPKAFWSGFNSRGKFYETVRDFARWVGEHDWFLHLTAKRSVLALATTKETAARLRVLEAGQIDIVGESGLSQEEIQNLGNLPIPADVPVRFISMGRLLHWKGFALGLRAFASAKLDRAEYWIVGDGADKERLQTLVEELGITNQVKFWGKLPRHETLQKLGECHVLVHPSLHDSGGWVCLEAMAAGRPVVCLDLGGPSTQVKDEAGFKVPADDPDEAVRDLANAMTRLASDRELRIRMGQAGQRIVREVYDWDVKGQFFAQLYEKILDRR